MLTDNGMAFADLPKNRTGSAAMYLGHIFDRVCAENSIEHRLIKPYHPWANGQAERMNRTVKDATVKTFHYQDLESLKAHILTFVTAYNFAKHLKALRWRTPFHAICDAWTKDPSIFRINPHHLMPGPYMEQWHNELDPAFGERMGDYYRAFVTEEARALGFTLEDLRAWRPVAVAAKRGRKKKV